MSLVACPSCGGSGRPNDKFVFGGDYCDCPAGLELMTSEVVALEQKELARVALIEKTKPMCCMPECDKLADWDVRWGDSPDDYTHSCAVHVNDLLEEGKVNTLTPIPKEK